jgi:hypothetical protein
MTAYTCQAPFDFLATMRIEHDEVHRLGFQGSAFDSDVPALNVRLPVERGASIT